MFKFVEMKNEKYMRKGAFFRVIIFIICTAFTCDHYIAVPREVSDFTLTHIDHSGEMPVEIDSNQSAPRNAYVLKISLEFTREWTELEYNTELEDPIQALQITTLYPLNEKYPAGSEVTDCFKGFQLDERVDSLGYRPVGLTNLVTLYSPFVYLALLKEAQKGKQQFQVKMTLDSGKVFIRKTSSIYFL